jgi:hypothetical protein
VAASRPALIPLGVVAYLLVQMRRPKRRPFTNLDHSQTSSNAPRVAPPAALYVLAIGALVLALARPGGTRASKATVIVMDVSGSMLRPTFSRPARGGARGRHHPHRPPPDKFRVSLVSSPPA